MSINYRGTKITGTSTGKKKFPKSGVANAKHNEQYLNTTTGHVYVCDDPGKPADATWKYVRTAVVKKPGKGVSIGTPTRGLNGSTVYTAKWTIPKALTSTKAGDRIDGLYIVWTLDTNKKDPMDVWKTGNESRTGDSENLNHFVATKPKKTYTRQSFYPYTKTKVNSLTITVRPWNAKGKGPAASKTYAFEKPRKPSLSATSVNENGVVSCTVTTNPGNDRFERARTRIQVQRYDSSEAKPKWKTVQDYETASTSHTASQQVPNWQVVGKYVKVRFRALAQGLAGDSAWTDWKTHIVGWPNAATIKTKDVKVPGTTSNVVATFPISVNADSNHATDQVVLQKLVNTTARTAAEATASLDWEDTDYKDDGKCTALACSVGDLPTETGKWSWVRVKSWNDIEGIFFVYSKPYRVDALHVAAPTVADDKVKIVETAQGVNGTSYRVTMAWNRNGKDDADGTELSWSDEEDSWGSTERPTVFEFDDSEDEGEYTDSSTTPPTVYRSHRTLVVKGLREGEPTYMRARRYMDDVDGNRSYGPYSSQVAVIPTVAPSDVVLTAPAFAAAGSDVRYSWAFAGGGTQRAWQLVDVPTGAVIAEGTDAFGAATVPAARMAGFAVAGVVTAKVRVSTGGDFVASDASKTSIVAAPTLAIGSISTLAAQPLALSFTCNVSTASLAVVVRSDGADRQSAGGVVSQPAGDTVWSDSFTPTWTSVEDGYTASVTLPDGLPFFDKGGYTVTARATDAATGLQSPELTATFEVEWARKAPLPPGTITVTPALTVDDDGVPMRTCEIALAAPEDAQTGDLYDIYRVTHEGARLIASGYPLDATVTDDYAPFGDGTNAYRVSLVTPDGDEHWADYDYQLDGDVLRFDFAGSEHRYAELPYNITLSDSFEKDYEERVHMDGTRGGGWNAGVSRSASLSTDVLRVEDPETVAALYDMAQSAVPVFVRTPSGAAFQANVDMDADVEISGVMNCSFDASEMDLTAEYMLPPYEWEDLDPEQEGE